MITTEALYRDYHSRLRAFIRSRVRDESVADDLLQEVFLKTHVSLSSLRDATRVESWLYQIARNAVADHQRARPTDALTLDVIQPSEPDDVSRVRTNLANCLLPMIDALSPTYREAVRLSEIEGLAQREVASRLGLSLSGAKSRVQRGRAELRAMFEDCCRFDHDVRGHVVGYEARSEGGEGVTPVGSTS